MDSVDAALERVGELPRMVALAAMGRNRVIGADGKIPWHLPEDFRWFKRVTMGHTLVMGRKTWDSIGRPLPGRETVVLSRSLRNLEGARVIASAEFLNDIAGKLFVVGGAEIYLELLPQCEAVLLSRVDQAPEGDAFMPEFEAAFGDVEVLASLNGFDVVKYSRK